VKGCGDAVSIVLTLADTVFAPADERTTVYDHLSVEFDNYDAAAVTIIATSRHDDEDKQVAAMRLTKDQVSSLLTYLKMVHPMMGDEE
jgi:hypothetical protein